MIIQKFKASVLIVTLIVLGIILVTALSVSLTSIKQKTASMGESKSGVAFQNAQSGIEIAMDAILEYSTTQGTETLKTASELSAIGLFCNDPVSPEKYAKLIPDGTILKGNFTVELEKSDADVSTACSMNIIDIAAIKSVGTEASQKRAIEAVVASTNGPAWQNSNWDSISNLDSNKYKEWTYSSGTAWYPSNCMAWFSPSAPGGSGQPTGNIYPMSCLNNPPASDSQGIQQGWQMNGTVIRIDYSGGVPILRHWNGSNFTTDSWNLGYIKVMLWK